MICTGCNSEPALADGRCAFCNHDTVGDYEGEPVFQVCDCGTACRNCGAWNKTIVDGFEIDHAADLAAEAGAP
jgi:hypothetical protein